MGVYKLFTGSDGDSRIEEYDVSELANLTMKGTMRFSVQNNEPGNFSDFHPAASRRWHIHLAGRMIIGLSDGTSHTFNPGDVRWVEDDTGKGHTTTLPDSPTIALHVIPDPD